MDLLRILDVGVSDPQIELMRIEIVGTDRATKG